MAEATFDPCDAILILVADDESKTVKVHRSVLCKTSNFFKNAMKSEWSDQKADPYTVDLSDSPLKAVAHYVRWLYSSKLDMEVDIPDNSNASGKLEQNQGVEKFYEALVEAYIFGEKIMDATYTRAILGEVIQTNNQYLRSPGPSVLSKLYDGTVPGCLARRLFARFVAYNYFCDPEWNNYLEGYPRDLLVDVIKVMAS